MTAVLYPAFFRTEAIVSVPGFIIAGAFGGAIPVFFLRNAYVPVRNE